MVRDAAWKAERIQSLRDLLMQISFNHADMECRYSMGRIKRVQIACELVARCVENGSLTPGEGFEVTRQAMENVRQADELLAAGHRNEALQLIRGKSGHILEVDTAIHGCADMYVTGQRVGGKGMQLIEWLRSKGMNVTII